MSANPQPSPVATAWSERFWEGTKAGEFYLQRCKNCGEYAGYPKVFCPHCYSDGLQWERASGQGTVYTYSTVVANPPSTFNDEVPYTIAIVELAEGVRFLSRLIEVDLDEVRCGLPVEVVYVQQGGGVTMPFFHPSGDS